MWARVPASGAAFTSPSFPIPHLHLPGALCLPGSTGGGGGSVRVLPWSLPGDTRMSLSLLPRPWGTRPKTKASETSSGRGIPGDQDLLLRPAVILSRV